MKKKLFTILLLTVSLFLFGQGSCNFGTTSDATGSGENITTGGAYEYVGAADFDIPFGTNLKATSITFNVLKGAADLQYVNVAFLQEVEGMPGTVIQTFDGLVPTAQTLLYAIDDPELATYQISLNLPSQSVLQHGKYFLRLSAAAGDTNGAWWEITAEAQTAGAFDFNKFDNDPWGGTGYYSKVFQVLGVCEPSGETQPNYGTACQQGNESNQYEGATSFIEWGQIISVADDFIVPANTTFYLTDFTMNSMVLGGGLHNATIKIRSSVNGYPGPVLHSYIHKGPAVEQFIMSNPFTYVASVAIKFSFADQPIQLQAGTYFIEVIPTLNATQYMRWENTTQPGIGNNTCTSANGINWTRQIGLNQVFTVAGYCNGNLGTNAHQQTSGIQYYPNPVKDVLHMESKNLINSAAVFDMEGRKVSNYVVNNGAVNMQELASGIYLVKVQSENGVMEAFKIVKE